MSEDQHFNITQSAKIAQYLNKFAKTTIDHKSLVDQNITNSHKKQKTIDLRESIPGKKFEKKIKSKSLHNEQPFAKRKKTTMEERGRILRDQMVEKLMHSQFRNINQYLYENPTVQAIRYMTPELFKKYHDSYAQLVAKWPIKPLDVIIQEIEKLSAFGSRMLTIADLGCGEARLAQHFKEKAAEHTTVHSFDLVDYNEHITKASIDNVPLGDACCDIAIFCLSLMPTNIRDCIIETNRILKKKGLVYIAEVVSRFEENKFKVFINSMEQFGFSLKKETILQPDNYFVLFRFKKTSSIDKIKGLPGIHLKPCKYKVR